MKYFKRPWDELRGDEFDDWGTSIWYFETDESGLPTRQIEKYSNNRKLKYSTTEPEDEYGCIGDQELDLEEFSEFVIQKEEFEQEWNSN